MSIVADIGHRHRQDAYIQGDSTLFRLVSPPRSSVDELLNGKGAQKCEGRLHFIRQNTSYVSDNVILCMAEVLYHMSQRAMEGLANNYSGRVWQTCIQARKVLVIFDVKEIPDLIYIDTEECRIQVAAGTNPSEWLLSTVIVNPQCIYRPLQHASDVYRKIPGKRGIVYPSARHSRGLAVALFDDHTSSIKQIRATIEVTLTLAEEGTSNLATDPNFSMLSGKLSHIRGHYRMSRNALIANRNLIQPTLLQAEGFIDLVRRPYSVYPNDAVSTY